MPFGNNNFGMGQETRSCDYDITRGRAATHYDMQKLKQIYLSGSFDTRKETVMGALTLTLYLDFINLFLMLLTLFGGGGRRR